MSHFVHDYAYTDLQISAILLDGHIVRLNSKPATARPVTYIIAPRLEVSSYNFTARGDLERKLLGSGPCHSGLPWYQSVGGSYSTKSIGFDHSPLAAQTNSLCFCEPRAPIKAGG